LIFLVSPESRYNVVCETVRIFPFGCVLFEISAKAAKNAQSVFGVKSRLFAFPIDCKQNLREGRNFVKRKTK